MLAFKKWLYRDLDVMRFQLLAMEMVEGYQRANPVDVPLLQAIATWAFIKVAFLRGTQVDLMCHIIYTKEKRGCPGDRLSF